MYNTDFRLDFQDDIEFELIYTSFRNQLYIQEESYAAENCDYTLQMINSLKGFLEQLKKQDAILYLIVEYIYDFDISLKN
jgi:hypothetical protein